MSDWFLILTEIMLFVCGAVSIFLLNLNNRYSKYGVIIGLIGQPFWYISAYNSQSWGIFSVSILYSISFIVGIYNFWFKNKIKGS